MPTLTIDNTGTGGSGFAPVFGMQVNEIEITNAGTGYTTAPTVTIGNLGSLYDSDAGGTAPTPVAPIATGGFGSVDVTATSNIGGSGDINVGVPVNGVGGLNKIGGGTVTLKAANGYTGATDVQAGTFELEAASLATAKVSVQSGATFTMDASSSLRANVDSLAVFDVFTQLSGGTAVLDGTLNIDLIGGPYVLGDSWDLFNLASGPADGFDAINIIGDFSGSLTEAAGLWTGTAGSLSLEFNESTGVLSVVPEPTTLSLLGLAAMGLGRRRRR